MYHLKVVRGDDYELLTFNTYDECVYVGEYLVKDGIID